MKKIPIWFTVLLLMACSPYENSDAGGKDGKSYIGTIVDVISRVYMDADLSLHYNGSDAISLFSTTTNSKYIFIGKQGDSSGEFVREGVQGSSGKSLGRTYALYPYNKSTSISSDGVISSTLAADQIYAENSVGRGANMMVAVTSSKKDNQLNFKNLCSYICVELYGKNVLLKSLKLQTNGGEKVAGDLIVRSSSDSAPEATAAQGAVDMMTLNLNGGVKLSESGTEPTKFYFATLPTTLSAGFTITATNAEGNVFTVKEEGKVVLERIQSIR